MNRISPHTARLRQSSQGFTLLEIALAMVILGVVAIYTLDMYQSISSRKKVMDDRGRVEEIVTALKAYFSGHEGLPPAATMGATNNVVPIADLGLGQIYRFDTHGRPYLYFQSGTASGFTVDSRPAAGVVISLGENQVQDYTLAGTNYSTSGDDLLIPVEVNTEAVAIALAELEILGKRVEAYNRDFAGVQNNPGTDYYGDVAAGAPPILDPDWYDRYYPGVDPAADDHPELYPYVSSAYVDNSGNSEFIQPGADWPTTFPNGPPPTFQELVQHEPVNWPGVGAYDGVILNSWEANLDPPGPDITSAAGWVWPDPGTEDPTATGGRPLPPGYTVTDPNYGFFGVYPDHPYYLGTATSALPAYELIDEGGCTSTAGDPNCVFVDLDSGTISLNTLQARYGFGTSLLTDPWGNFYQWGSSFTYANTDPQYHLFFSAGPDGTPGTPDDILLF